MLVLSRKVGESLVIGGGLVIVRITRIAGNRVTVGIEAPVELKVVRGELLKGDDAKAAGGPESPA